MQREIFPLYLQHVLRFKLFVPFFLRWQMARWHDRPKIPCGLKPSADDNAIQIADFAFFLFRVIFVQSKYTVSNWNNCGYIQFICHKKYYNNETLFFFVTAVAVLIPAIRGRNFVTLLDCMSSKPIEFNSGIYGLTFGRFWSPFSPFPWAFSLSLSTFAWTHPLCKTGGRCWYVVLELDQSSFCVAQLRWQKRNIKAREEKNKITNKIFQSQRPLCSSAKKPFPRQFSGMGEVQRHLSLFRGQFDSCLAHEIEEGNIFEVGQRLTKIA